MRVHELAKALNLTSKELLVKLKALKIEAKSATTTLDADAINRARKALTVKKPPVKKLATPASSKLAGRAPMAKAPASAPPGKKTALGAPLKEPAKRSSREGALPSVGRETTAKPPAASAKPSSAVKPSGGLGIAAPSGATTAEAPVHPSPTGTPAAASARPGESPLEKRPAAATTSHAVPRATAVVAPPTATPDAPARTLPAHASVSGSAAGVPQPVTAAPAGDVIPASAAPAGPPRRLELRCPVTVKDLAAKMDVKPNDLIKHLMQEQHVFASIVQLLDEATATKAAAAFHCEIAPQPTIEDQMFKAAEPDPAKLAPRAPVVTFMGHVDHGKTSLLDAIRQAKVAEKEAGGITQHIGAYEVQLEKGRVTFLDTPGHEAFSALRSRGANVTDIVVLVVAADDGVMPQTVEAIDHAKAANVPIVVAMNKMDKPEANPQKVMQQLSQHGLIGEEWGGKTIMVPVSARTRQGIDTLLEMLLLEAELLELKADPTAPAQGVIIEAKQTRERGPVATALIQQGTLRVGDPLLVGHLVGRVRAMHDDRGHRMKDAGPAKAMEILGLPEVPKAGDRFLVVPDERVAKQIAERRRERQEEQALTHPKRITLQELHQRIIEGQLKDLRLILKADVQGSLEAIVQSLEKLDTEKEEVQFKILHTGVGDINESDVILAAASDAIIVGFHVGIEPKVQVLAVAEGVDVHIYQIIYELVEAIRAAIEGLLEPTIEETFIGRAEIRRIFQVSRSGIVAGCFVTKGSIRRDCVIRIIRGRDRLAEAKIANLKRVKDDVREVQEGLECGILLEGNAEMQIGDLLEAWELKKVARKLA